MNSHMFPFSPNLYRRSHNVRLLLCLLLARSEGLISLSLGPNWPVTVGDHYMLSVWVLALQASPVLLEGCSAVPTVQNHLLGKEGECKLVADNPSVQPADQPDHLPVGLQGPDRIAAES